MKLKLSFFLTVIFCYTTVFAQNVISEVNESQWRIAPVMGNYRIRINGESYEKGIIQLPNGNAIVTIRYPKEEHGIAMIDADGKILWESRIKGAVLSLCRLQDKVIAFYSEELEFPTWSDEIKSIHAIGVDISNGATIADKIVSTNSTGKYIEARAYTNPNNQACHLLIRYTNFNSNAPFSGNSQTKNQAATNDLQLITINSDLSVTNTQKLNSRAVGALFIGSDMLPDGHLFIVTKDKDELVAEKIDINTARVTDHVTTPVKYYPKTYVNAIFVHENNHIFLSTHYEVDNNDHRFAVYDIDFPAKKISQQETALGPDFIKYLEKQNGSIPKVLKKRGIRELRPVAIVVTENKIAVVNEYQNFRMPSANSRSVIFSYLDLVISVYDKKLNSTGHIILPRGYSSFISSGTSIGTVIREGKLILVCNANTGGGSLGAEFFKIDLDKLKFERQLLKKNNLPSDAHIEGNAIIWLENKALVPYYVPKGVGTKAWTSRYQLVSY